MLSTAGVAADWQSGDGGLLTPKGRMMTPRVAYYGRHSIRGCGRIFSSSTNCNCSPRWITTLNTASTSTARLKIYPTFDQLANLFAPVTVDACYAHDGTGTSAASKPKKANGTSLATATASCV